MDRNAIAVMGLVSLLLLVPVQAPVGEDLAKGGGVTARATSVMGTISRVLFGDSGTTMDQNDCVTWFGGGTADAERANNINLVCGQIMKGGTDGKLKFYFLYGFMPFIVLMYIFKDMMLLFTFLTPRTANVIALCLGVYAVFLSHGIFSVVMGLLNFLGGPGSGFDFTQVFFSVLFFSLIFGFFFDSIFRFFIETSRVSKAIQYQMYEIAAETQLGKWRSQG